MSEHTPGPWEKVDGTDGITRGIRGWHGPEIVNVINWNGISRATSVTGQANAKLIVAAPELLRLLNEALRTLEMWQDVLPAVILCEDIRSAIAKATGGES